MMRSRSVQPNLGILLSSTQGSSSARAVCEARSAYSRAARLLCATANHAPRREKPRRGRGSMSLKSERR